jgi:hypothetical protein
MNPNIHNVRLTDGSKMPSAALQALAALTPEQRFDIASADIDSVAHGVEVTEAVQCAAYWWDCNE